MNATPQAVTLLVARILLAAMFVASGISKLTGLEGTAGYIASKGLPLPMVAAAGAGIVELVAGVLLVIGWQTRWAALALAAFTVLASVLFHNFWAMPAEQQMMQQLMFMKNMAVTGGLLFAAMWGAGALSVDARRGGADARLAHA